MTPAAGRICVLCAVVCPLPPAGGAPAPGAKSCYLHSFGSSRPGLFLCSARSDLRRRLPDLLKPGPGRNKASVPNESVILLRQRPFIGPVPLPPLLVDPALPVPPDLLSRVVQHLQSEDRTRRHPLCPLLLQHTLKVLVGKAAHTTTCTSICISTVAFARSVTSLTLIAPSSSSRCPSFAAIYRCISFLPASFKYGSPGL